MPASAYAFSAWTNVASFTRTNSTFPGKPWRTVVDGQRIAILVEHATTANIEVGISLDGGTTWLFYDSGLAAGGSTAGLVFALGSLWIGELTTPSLRRSDDFGQTWVADSVATQWAATSKTPFKANSIIYAASGPGVASNTIRRRDSANNFTAIGTIGTQHYSVSDQLPNEAGKVLIFDNGGSGALFKMTAETAATVWTRAGQAPTSEGGLNPMFGATSSLRIFHCRDNDTIDRTLNNGAAWASTTPVYTGTRATGFIRLGTTDFAVNWSGIAFAIMSITDTTTTWTSELANAGTASFNVAYAAIGNVTSTSADVYVITQNTTSFKVWKSTISLQSTGFPNRRLNYEAAEQSFVKFYDNMKAVAIGFPAGSNTVNSVTLWYFVGKGFVEDSRTWRMVVPFAVNDISTKIFAWDAGAGILREIDVDAIYTDDGNAIVPRLDTGFVRGTERDVETRWAWLGFITSEIVDALIKVTVGDDSQTDTFEMRTNQEERLNVIGRRVRLIIDFTSSGFFRLSEIILRHLPFRSFRPRS